MKPHARWFVAWSFLLLAIHEAHELAHAVAGRLVCGHWPVRDFNAWRFVGECTSYLPTAAGPAFSYALMFIGALLAHRTKHRWAGIALLFAANPFARIFTAIMGGGDEMVVGQYVSQSATRTLSLRLAVLAFVVAICGSAIVAGWRAMKTVPRKALVFALLLAWPMILTGVALFVVGNGLLNAGVLASPMIGGAPLLVLLVSGAAAVLAALTLRWLTEPSVTVTA
jgi:hypothetical protein